MNYSNEDETVKVSITIRAEVPPQFLPTMFDKIRVATPLQAKLVFEVDGR